MKDTRVKTEHFNTVEPGRWVDSEETSASFPLKPQPAS